MVVIGVNWRIHLPCEEAAADQTILLGCGSPIARFLIS